MAEVRLRGVNKRFGQTHAVRDVDLEIDDREFVVLVGPSGCGKSTTLRMIAGLEEISSGTIEIGGRLVNRLPPKDRDIAMVFQNYALYAHMNVYDNLAFGLRNRQTPEPEIRQKIDGAARMLGLSELLGRRPHQLSGGQQQRVALGRCIVRNPKVFLFDEPLSNLDAKLRAQMRAEIKRLRERVPTTSIYVTHDQLEAMTLGDRLVVMQDGRVQQLGTALEVYGAPRTRFVAGFIGSPTMNFLDATLRGEGTAMIAQGVGMRLELPAQFAQTLADHRSAEVTLGIRPEHVHLVPPEGASDMEATVEFTEQLGSELLVNVTFGTTALTVARVNPSIALTTGALVSLRFDRDHLHFFDRVSEDALAHGPGARRDGTASAPSIASAYG